MEERGGDGGEVQSGELGRCVSIPGSREGCCELQRRKMVGGTTATERI